MGKEYLIHGLEEAALHSFVQMFGYFRVLILSRAIAFHFQPDPVQSKLGKKDCGTNALFAVYCKEIIYRTAIYQEHYIEVLIEISVGLECW